MLMMAAAASKLKAPPSEQAVRMQAARQLFEA
jgi:hypothetical protein